MRLRRVILFLLSIFCAVNLCAQPLTDLAQSRILIMLDRSSSMVQSWAGGKEKYKAADELINKLMDSLYAVNPEVEIGLRVFGHQYTAAQNNCYDTKLEVLFSKDNRTQVALRLGDLHPLGVTPIAYALQQAATFDLVNETKNAYCIVLITDGGESCGGDICDVMNKFIKSKIHFKPYIVSLEDYAPLRTTYACMGDYLQVLKEGDISPAVGTIIEAFRPILRITNSEFKQMLTTANVPSVLKVSTPAINMTQPADDNSGKEPKKEKIKFTKPPPNEIPDLINERPKLFAIAAPRPERLKPIEQMPTLAPVEVAPDPPVQIARLAVRLRPISIPAPRELQLKMRELIAFTPEPATEITKEKIARMQPVGRTNMNVIFVIEEHNFVARAVPPLPQVKQEFIAAKPVAPKPMPVKPPTPESKTGVFRTETVDAQETTVEIYFTDGHGKFYNSTPQVQLLDPGTNQMVKKFYRTVDEHGNPDPQEHILPRRYDIAFTESRGVINRNVEVVAGKRNKIYVIMPRTSLSFYYLNNPDRPVKEFAAVVTERNKVEGGRVQNQKCTEKIEYEPGNYHIVINTFPEDVRNVDLDFNETGIQLLEPGFLKLTSDGKAHDITLWKRYGDKFMQFHYVNISDPRYQHLQIQPGEYQVHFQKGPGPKSATEKVKPFLIKATELLEVSLN